MHSFKQLLPTSRLPALPLVVATVLAMALVISARPALAVSDGGTFDPVDGVTVSPGQQAGEIVITWNAATPTPNDYRVSWAPADENFRSLTQTDWNQFPTSNELTVSGLDPGATYKAKVRARYGAQGRSPWSDVAYGDSAQIATTSNQEVGDGVGDPLIAAQQQAVPPPIPTATEECRQQMRDGSVIRCSANDFSVRTIRPKGDYHIDWSEWHRANADRVDRYTIERLRFMYYSNTRNPIDNTPADIDATPGVSYVEPGGCRPTPVANPDGSLSHYRWLCDGLANVRKDLAGNPTAPETVIDFNADWDTPQWSGLIASPGRTYDVPLTGMTV